MIQPRVLHLVDDTTAGGVMRVVDFIQSAQSMAKVASHRVHPVERGKFWRLGTRADVIVSHTALSWRSLPAIIALRLMHPRTPVVHVEHSYTEGFVAHNVTRKKRFATLLRVAFSLFDRVVAVSEAQAKWFKTQGFCKATRCLTIQSCVDLQAFRNLPAATRPTRIFAAIGRLDPQKGFDTLIDAFQEVKDPNIRLHIIGTGAEHDRLVALAKPDTRIIFRGMLPDPVKALSEVDAVLMPSRWEAYGLVAIEALAAGRPLVCHAVDGMHDHEALGARLIPEHVPTALSIAIEDLTTSTDDKCDTRLCRVTTTLEDRFARRWNALLLDLLPKQKASSAARLLSRAQS
jgi:glycosyltransferase involved in cell wall biosynthesis